MKVAIKGYHGDAVYQMKLLLQSDTTEVVVIDRDTQECEPDIDVCVVSRNPACWRNIIKKTKCLIWFYMNFTMESNPTAAAWLYELDKEPNFCGYIDSTSRLKKYHPGLKKPSFSFIVNYSNYPLLHTSGTKIVSLINGYPKLWPREFQQAQSIVDESTLYGNGNPAGGVSDRDALREAKFLLHLKPTGCVCQAVIKAIASGVPVLTDEDTWRCGLYENYTQFMAVHPFKSYTEIKPWLDKLTDTAYNEIKQRAITLAEGCRQSQRIDLVYFVN